MTAPPPIILFASEAAANHLVAGIPAAARAVMNADVAQQDRPINVAVPGGWEPSSFCRTEAARLALRKEWIASDASSQSGATAISGTGLQLGANEELSAEAADIPALQEQSRRIVAATGKAGDGLVSRYINRPISQAISRILLKSAAIRPWHVTATVALIGIVMVTVLFLGGARGLIAGAVLFQIASIVDGVDGEIARATFRTSEQGASLDNATDIATNVGFISGVSFNLYFSGAQIAGLVGALSAALMVLGAWMALIRSKHDGGPFTYDGLKVQFHARPSRLKQVLAYISMRDLYAFVAFLAIIAGLAAPALFVFSLGALIWFGALCGTLTIRQNG